MRGRRTVVAVALIVVTLAFALGAKRRAVRSAPCPGPSLTLSVTPQTACPGDAVTLTWRSGNNKSVVTIDGVGENLPWTGSTRIMDGRRSFTGYATND